MKRKSFAVLRLQEKWPDLKYVKDATKNLTLEILECDIAKAVRNDPTKCAIQIGAKHSTHCEDIIVGRSTAYIKKGEMAVRYIVPIGAQKELIAFDRGGGFLAGTYELKKPWAGNTLKAVAKQGPHPTKNKGTMGPRKPIRNMNHSNRPRISPS